MSWPRWTKRANAALDSLLYRISVYAVPGAIAAMSVVALLAWNGAYNASGNRPLEFRVFEQTGEAPTLGQALARLEERPAVDHLDTRLSESPFWFSFTVLPAANDERTTLELPSRHAFAVSCWDAARLNSLGNANREAASGQMNPAKAGFVLELGRQQSQSPLPVLCRATFAGPGRVNVVQWPQAQFELSAQKFHRDSGLLDGGLIVLSLFVLLTAIINREWIYVLFAAWLIANLRLAAISAGWDTQWLERSIPADWLLLTRKLTAAVNYLLTYTLFTTILREDLKRVGYTQLLRIAQWLCLPLLLLAAILPFSQVLPFMWIAAGVGSTVLTFFLGRILVIARSTVALLYSASF
jgi:hypothetical protein